MRVGLYPRVSGHEQEDNYSIPEQIDRMKKYCESRDWMVYKIYTDSVYTGANMDRPGLQDMIKDCENGKIDMVLVYKLDRLSRSQKDTLFLIEDVFEKNGVGFTSMTENFDTSTPFGKAILGVLAVFSQLEHSKIKERTMLGKDSRAKEGKWHGGQWIPIGYDYDGLLMPNEYEAMQVREIADLFLKGTPIRTIERMVTKKGYRHKYGEWEAKTIRRVLQNPVNVGLIKNRDKWYKGIHEPILEQKTFDAIQKLMEERRKEYGTARPHQSLLGGILYCKNCGARYARQSYNGKFYAYMCYSRSKKMKKMIKDPTCKNKNHRMEVLEGAILGEIHKLAIDPERIEQVRENRPISDVAEKIKSITSEIAKIDTQISKMMDLYALGTIDLDVISEKVADLNSTKTALAKEMDSLNVPNTEDVMTDEQIRSIAALMNDELPLEDKRNIVQSLIFYIEIDEDDVIIHWKF
jgi:site-specific DNA recombinase